MSKETQDTIMQDTITIEINGKEVQSNPFSFADYAEIQDKHLRGYSGECKLCYDTLIHMFRGTAATYDYIETLSIAERGMLCGKVLKIYIGMTTAVNKLIKNQ